MMSLEMVEPHRPEGRHPTQPLAPGPAPDASLLQGEGEELLGEDVKRFRRRHDGFDVSVEPEAEQTGRSQEAVVGRGEEQAVPLGPRPAAGAAQPLEEGGDGAGSVDLDDAVEVADVDSQLQGARGDDDTVQPFEERLGVADGRRQTKSLDFTSRQAAHAFQDREQMPAAIVTGERVQLVDDDGLEIPEKHTRFRAGRDEHDLDRLGCG